MRITHICYISLLILYGIHSSTVFADDSKLMRYDFGKQGCDRCDWFVVVDGVMGGLSSGRLTIEEKSMVMAGDISLENNGGFASLRTDYQRYDLSPYSSVVIKYRSTGQDFAMTLNNYRRFWRPQFKVALPDTDNQWVEKTLNFSDFKKMRFDEVLGGGPSTKELSNVIRLGFISNEKKASPYVFEVASIEFL